jgi:hypothetical protein
MTVLLLSTIGIVFAGSLALLAIGDPAEQP